MSTDKKYIGTIDMTPTWEETGVMLIRILEDGNETGRKNARVELMRMARLADAYVALSKDLGTPITEAAVAKPAELTDFIVIGNNRSWGRGHTPVLALQAMRKQSRVKATHWRTYHVTANTYVNDTGGLNRPAKDPVAVMVQSTDPTDKVTPL